MGKAKLKILELEVPMDSFSVYHDDGFVEDAIEHCTRLDRKYGLREGRIRMRAAELRLLKIKHAGIGGCYDRYEKGCEDHHHIWYFDTGFDPNNIRVRAHEETHALDGLGGLRLLEQRIFEEHGLNLDLSSYIDRRNDERVIGRVGEEMVADLGSVYALLKYGFDPREILEDGLKREGFEKALKIYGG